MKKIAIVITSFSGFLKDEIESFPDLYITPLQIFVDEEQWYEGFYTKEERDKIVEKFKNANDFKTSLAPIGIVEEQMQELSEKYDDVLYLPINSTLSSSHNSILNISRNFKNVHVFDSKLSGPSFMYVAQEIKKLYEKENWTISKILKLLKWYDENTIGYIIPLELKTFIKSGRLKGIKKAIMTSLNLSTIIEVNKELASVGIKRTRKIAANKVMEKINDFIKERHKKIDDFVVTIVYTFDKEISNIFENALKTFFDKKADNIVTGSIATMIHTGFGAGYIGINPKFNWAPQLMKKDK